MPYSYYDEYVDLYTLPAPLPPEAIDTMATFYYGDNHANVLCLIRFLVRQGIYTISSQAYTDFVRLSHIRSIDLTAEHLTARNLIIRQMQVQNVKAVCLIGDETGDRANLPDDGLLELCDKMREDKIPFEILASNHGVEFVLAYERYFEMGIEGLRPTILTLDGHEGRRGFAQSLLSLNDCIKKGIICIERVLELIERSYKPFLKLFSYSLSPDRTQIILASHAAIDLRSIRIMADRLGVEYLDDTAVQLACTLEHIQFRFRTDIVERNQVHALCRIEYMYLGFSTVGKLKPSSGMPFILWNRSTLDLMRPARYKGYGIIWVHGHDSSDETCGHLINLDNHFGKGCESHGVYKVLSAYFKPLPIEEIPPLSHLGAAPILALCPPTDLFLASIIHTLEADSESDEADSHFIPYTLAHSTLSHTTAPPAILEQPPLLPIVELSKSREEQGANTLSRKESSYLRLVIFALGGATIGGGSFGVVFFAIQGLSPFVFNPVVFTVLLSISIAVGACIAGAIHYLTTSSSLQDKRHEKVKQAPTPAQAEPPHHAGLWSVPLPPVGPVEAVYEQPNTSLHAQG